MINPVVTDSWFNCYRQGWGNSLRPESFAHPAKVSRNLAKRIYEHMREERWLHPGDTILDPFAGIGGFALDALAMGCHFIGIELERPFVDMASGCECTGVSKADWVRFYGRLDRMRYSGERYICPRCIAEAKGILPESTAQVVLFEHTKDSASYRRNSGKIPETKAHHYVGNLEAWAKLGLPGTAVILQGDSRKLLAWNFAGGKVEAVVSSSPYVGDGHHKGAFDTWGGEISKGKGGCSDWAKKDGGYGSSPANLGNMKEGDVNAVVDCTISSPPYNGPFAQEHPGRAGGKRGVEPSEPGAFVRYGNTPGQLEGLPEGDIAACLSSPPYAQSVNADSHGIDWTKAGPGTGNRKRGDGTQHEATLRAQLSYGSSPANLGSLPPGSLEAVADNCISSPPYEGSNIADARHLHFDEKRRDSSIEEKTRNGVPCGYSEGPDNLGNSSGDTFWSASRTILEQLFLCINPQGHAVFVVGNFIRGGKVVPFAHQWLTLCESVGFVNLHWHTAHKTERYGTQLNTDGGEEVDEVSRVSFFRRLQAKKGGETISSEEVLCFLRP